MIFQWKKNQETLHIGLKFDMFFKLYGWTDSPMKNIQYSIPFNTQELWFRGVLECQFRKSFVY